MSLFKLLNGPGDALVPTAALAPARPGTTRLEKPAPIAGQRHLEDAPSSSAPTLANAARRQDFDAKNKDWWSQLSQRMIYGSSVMDAAARKEARHSALLMHTPRGHVDVEGRDLSTGERVNPPEQFSFPINETPVITAALNVGSALLKQGLSLGSGALRTLDLNIAAWALRHDLPGAQLKPGLKADADGTVHITRTAEMNAVEDATLDLASGALNLATNTVATVADFFADRYEAYQHAENLIARQHTVAGFEAHLLNGIEVADPALLGAGVAGTLTRKGLRMEIEKVSSSGLKPDPNPPTPAKNPEHDSATPAPALAPTAPEQALFNALSKMEPQRLIEARDLLDSRRTGSYFRDTYDVSRGRITARLQSLVQELGGLPVKPPLPEVPILLTHLLQPLLRPDETPVQFLDRVSQAPGQWAINRGLIQPTPRESLAALQPYQLELIRMLAAQGFSSNQVIRTQQRALQKMRAEHPVTDYSVRKVEADSNYVAKKVAELRHRLNPQATTWKALGLSFPGGLPQLTRDAADLLAGRPLSPLPSTEGLAASAAQIQP